MTNAVVNTIDLFDHRNILLLSVELGQRNSSNA